MTNAITAKVNVIRALSAVVARRVLLFFLVIDSTLLLLLFAGIWALAHNFSAWWWLLLFIWVPIVLASVTTYLVARFIAKQLYPRPLLPAQKQQLRDFTDKILRLLETRGMGWWWFASLCVRDLLLYRELRTLQELIADATSLKSDLAALERELE